MNQADTNRLYRWRSVILLLLPTILCSNAAFGWGSEGHEVVVRMAIQKMSALEQKAVFELLGTHDYHMIGNWADSIKDFNGTKQWHYVDIPGRDEHYKAERDCPDGNCILAKLDAVRTKIRNHFAPRKERREALLYWFHLVGDLFQPFHCIGDKAGGNEIRISVYFKKKPTNLHALWDNGIIHYKNPSARSLADEIMNGDHRNLPSNMTFIDAAEKSHIRANDMKLKNNTKVTGDYVARAWAMIHTCLWEAACMAATIGPDL